MNDLKWKAVALVASLACCLSASAAETAIRFDSAPPKDKPSVSLLQSIREATQDAELPVIGAIKEATVAAPASAARTPGSVARTPGSAAKAVELPKGAKAEPAFWGRDGRWCPDGQVYRGGPCDNGWGGGWRDPYDPYRGPYRDPYYDPHRGPYRDPYYDPYRGPYRDPYYPGPWYGGGSRSPHRGPGQGPTREPWRDPPTRRGWRR